MTEATDRPKVMVIFGTRPEAIKMAPVIRALNDSPLRSIVVVTGQHRDMLDQVLQLFAIHPDYDLAIMRHGQTLSDVTVRVLTGLEEVLERENPDLVLVHGDTTTAMASALASYYHRIPVGHVEAGLRTEHPYNPFPEEMNRRLISRIAALHFAPTETAKQNLVRENVSPSSIYVTGNTVIDALVSVIRSDYRFRDPELARIVALPGRMLLVTAHRRENLGAPMVRIFRALREILSRFADTRVVFPMHKNPAVRHLIKQELGMLERVHLVEPPNTRSSLT